MPYAPGIQSQPIHADMSGWGQALMHFADQSNARKEQAKEEAKSFKTYVAMGEQMGLSKDEMLTKDLPTVKGMVEGTMTKNKLTELKQLSDWRGLQMQQIQQQMAQHTADARHVADFQRSYRNVTTPMNIPAGTFGALSPQETIGGGPLDASAVADLYLKSGAPIAQMDDLMRGMQYGAKASAGQEDRAPVVREVGGHNVIYSPATGKYDLLDRASTQQGLSYDQKVQLMDRQALLRSKANLEKSISLLPKDSELHTDAAAKLDSINAQLGGDTPPPADHISWLRAHPEKADSFDSKYGKGAAAKYLK